MMVKQGMEKQGRLVVWPEVLYTLSLFIAPIPDEAGINVSILQTRKLRLRMLNSTKNTRELRGWHLDLSLYLTPEPSPGPSWPLGE